MTDTAVQVDEVLVRKLLGVVDAGLTSGRGRRKPGEMCVEAAVCFALGQPHGDQPTCVGPAVRAYKIGLNDAAWSSPAARAKGMRLLVEMGSEGSEWLGLCDGE